MNVHTKWKCLIPKGRGYCLHSCVYTYIDYRVVATRDNACTAHICRTKSINDHHIRMFQLEPDLYELLNYAYVQMSINHLLKL